METYLLFPAQQRQRQRHLDLYEIEGIMVYIERGGATKDPVSKKKEVEKNEKDKNKTMKIADIVQWQSTQL